MIKSANDYYAARKLCDKYIARMQLLDEAIALLTDKMRIEADAAERLETEILKYEDKPSAVVSVDRHRNKRMRDAD